MKTARLVKVLICLGASAVVDADPVVVGITKWEYHFDPGVYVIRTTPDQSGGVVASLLYSLPDPDPEDDDYPPLLSKLVWLNSEGGVNWESPTYGYPNPMVFKVMHDRLIYGLDPVIFLVDLNHNPIVTTLESTAYLGADSTDSENDTVSVTMDAVFCVVPGPGHYAIRKIQIPPPDTYIPLTPTRATGYNGNNLVISWQSEPNRLYQIQKSTDLIDWENVGEPIIGTGAIQNYSQVIAGPSCYLRIVPD